MTTSAPDGDSREKRLDDILANYLEAERLGQPLDREQLLARHPDLADELRSFFRDKDQFAQMAEPLHPAARPDEPAEAATLAPREGPADPLLGTVRYIGDYELLAELGRGGMGVVYKARQVSLGRLVALKMILAGGHAGPDELARFRSEASAIARLQHPNIVQVFEVGEHEGHPFFSLEFCPGGALDHQLDGTPWEPRKATQLVETLARAMQAAHEAQVVHRDLKPANVLLAADGTPKVTDFGLARKLDEVGQTQTGAVLGTPSYMAPEQAEGKKAVGPAADIYALGAILYELLTGRPPFKAATGFDTLMQVLTEEPAPPRLLNPGISRDLEPIVLKCLHKEPGQRYPSAVTLADDLRALREGRPIRARRPGLGERLGRWAGRHRQSVFRTVMAVGLLAGLIGGGVVLWQWWRAGNQDIVGWQTSGVPHSVQLFQGDDPALPPFTVARLERVALSRGWYDVEVSAPHLLSERYGLSVSPGYSPILSINLGGRLLWEPIPVPEQVFFVPGAQGHDILVPAGTSVRRLNGKTGEERWRSTPTKDYFFNHSDSRGDGALDRYGTVPVRLGPLLDLDGDGVPDLIWASGWNAGLLALSGATGQVLWSHPVASEPAPGKDPRPGARANGRTIGLPVLHTPVGGKPLLLTSFVLGGDRPERFVEALEAGTGKRVWRFDLDDRWFAAQANHPDLFGPHLTPGNRPVALVVAGEHLVGLDPETGRPAWPAVQLGFAPAQEPHLADLDGDGSPEVLLLDRSRSELVVVGLPAGRELWRHKMALANSSGDFLVTDLDGDGRPEVVVSGEHGSVLVLDGATGKTRWQVAGEGPRYRSAPARFLLGPDLDGDGHPDLFVTRAIQDDDRHRSLIRVKAVAGASGRVLWQSALPEANAFSVIESLSGSESPFPWAPPFWWQLGRDGWPLLVLPSSPHGGRTFVVEASCGRVVHFIDDVPRWHPPVDLDGDGIPDLIAYQLPPSLRGERIGRLCAFRGTPPKRYHLLERPALGGDLDGDGVPDFPWAKGGPISGATGRPLGWHLDGVTLLPDSPPLRRSGKPLLLGTAIRTRPSRHSVLLGFEGTTRTRLWESPVISDLSEIGFRRLLPLPGRQADTDDILAVIVSSQSQGGSGRLDLVRLDGDTGQTRWLAERNPRFGGYQASVYQFLALDLGGGGRPGILLSVGDPDIWALLAFDAGTGQLVWEKPVRGRSGQFLWADPVRGDRMVLAGRQFDVLDSGKGTLIVYREEIDLVLLDGATGREQLRTPQPSVPGAPRLIQTRDGPAVVALQVEPAGRALVRFDLQGQVRQRLTLRQVPRGQGSSAQNGEVALSSRRRDGNTLFVFDGTRLAAVDADTWAVRWRTSAEFPTGTWVWPDRTDATMDPETVVLGVTERGGSSTGEGTETRLWWVDVKTGDVRWHYQGRGLVLGLSGGQLDHAPRVFVQAGRNQSPPRVSGSSDDDVSTICFQAAPTTPDGRYCPPERGEPPTQLEVIDWRPLPAFYILGQFAPSSNPVVWLLALIYFLLLWALLLFKGWRAVRPLLAAYLFLLAPIVLAHWRLHPGRLEPNERYAMTGWEIPFVLAGALMGLSALPGLVLWAVIEVVSGRRRAARPTVPGVAAPLAPGPQPDGGGAARAGPETPARTAE